MAPFLLISYYGLFAILSVYGMHRALLLLRLLRRRREAARVELPAEEARYPLVTVQLPVFNERYVATRLLDAVAAFDWPKERLEIQVLDDSTDETSGILAERCRELAAEGFEIRHLRRKNRKGYKAGALAEGLRGGEGEDGRMRAPARGEFVAIFDADFLPQPDFLKRSLPYLLADEGLGLVQARWEHINRDHSLLTRLQAVFLDAHFAIEHQARERAGHFLNFNGTAGVWRRSAIEAAGGWSHDTLTEDLDLSFRVQMEGIRFHYLHDLGVPAELPAEMNGFKNQQHRWAKGSIEVARKLLLPLWRHPGVPLGAKLEGSMHLLNNLAYLVVAIASFLTLPVALARGSVHPDLTIWADRYLLGIGLLPVLSYFLIAQLLVGRRLLPSLLLLPAALALGIGLSINNAKAVLEGLLGHRTGFVRTPKYHIHAAQDSWIGKCYSARKSLGLWLEIFLGLEALAAFGVAAWNGCWSMGLFFLFFATGYLYTGLLSALPSLAERLRSKTWTLRAATRPPVVAKQRVG
ncbi:MAG TPA: glycosyltransferase [Planctomycetes bacterium]|nr:glycosyltransferase [Planctomycetota bacterium]